VVARIARFYTIRAFAVSGGSQQVKIGFDLDNVLNCLEQPWADWIVANHDPNMTVDNWSQWHLHEISPAGKAVYDFLKLPGVFRELPVRPDAVEVTKRLQGRGHELFVISACGINPEVWPDKIAWLQQHFPHIALKNLIACERKGMIGVDCLVDDGPHNLADFPGTKIVFDHPWNRDVKVLRVKRFADFLNIF
jgi:5'(3')-deoxyribonucleotidase